MFISRADGPLDTGHMVEPRLQRDEAGALRLRGQAIMTPAADHVVESARRDAEAAGKRAAELHFAIETMISGEFPPGLMIGTTKS